MSSNKFLPNLFEILHVIKFFNDPDDMQIGFNSRFLLEMLNHLNSNDILLEMSLPNRAGILTPIDGLEEGEEITMLVMPVMLSN